MRDGVFPAVVIYLTVFLLGAATFLYPATGPHPPATCGVLESVNDPPRLWWGAIVCAPVTAIDGPTEQELGVLASCLEAMGAGYDMGRLEGWSFAEAENLIQFPITPGQMTVGYTWRRNQVVYLRAGWMPVPRRQVLIHEVMHVVRDEPEHDVTFLICEKGF